MFISFMHGRSSPHVETTACCSSPDIRSCTLVVGIPDSVQGSGGYHVSAKYKASLRSQSMSTSTVLIQQVGQAPCSPQPGPVSYHCTPGSHRPAVQIAGYAAEVEASLGELGDVEARLAGVRSLLQQHGCSSADQLLAQTAQAERSLDDWFQTEGAMPAGLQGPVWSVQIGADATMLLRGALYHGEASPISPGYGGRHQWTFMLVPVMYQRQG